MCDTDPAQRVTTPEIYALLVDYLDCYLSKAAATVGWDLCDTDP